MQQQYLSSSPWIEISDRDYLHFKTFLDVLPHNIIKSSTGLTPSPTKKSSTSSSSSSNLQQQQRTQLSKPGKLTMFKVKSAFHDQLQQKRLLTSQQQQSQTSSQTQTQTTSTTSIVSSSTTTPSKKPSDLVTRNTAQQQASPPLQTKSFQFWNALEFNSEKINNASSIDHQPVLQPCAGGNHTMISCLVRPLSTSLHVSSSSSSSETTTNNNNNKTNSSSSSLPPLLASALGYCLRELHRAPAFSERQIKNMKEIFRGGHHHNHNHKQFSSVADVDEQSILNEEQNQTDSDQQVESILRNEISLVQKKRILYVITPSPPEYIMEQLENKINNINSQLLKSSRHSSSASFQQQQQSTTIEFIKQQAIEEIRPISSVSTIEQLHAAIKHIRSDVQQEVDKEFQKRKNIKSENPTETSVISFAVVIDRLEYYELSAASAAPSQLWSRYNNNNNMKNNNNTFPRNNMNMAMMVMTQQQQSQLVSSPTISSSCSSEDYLNIALDREARRRMNVLLVNSDDDENENEEDDVDNHTTSTATNFKSNNNNTNNNNSILNKEPAVPTLSSVRRHDRVHNDWQVLLREAIGKYLLETQTLKKDFPYYSKRVHVGAECCGVMCTGVGYSISQLQQYLAAVANKVKQQQEQQQQNQQRMMVLGGSLMNSSSSSMMTTMGNNYHQHQQLPNEKSLVHQTVGELCDCFKFI